MFLPLIAVVVAYPFLPDKIPAHYGMNNQVTRWEINLRLLFFLLLHYSSDFYVYCSPRCRRTEKERKR
ncbi:MAG: DUF1648 domain-containing protein [Lachnospiraceae bacterium]